MAAATERGQPDGLGELLRAYLQDRGNGDARQRLALAYLPWVRSIATGMARHLPPSVELGDLVDEGMRGLLEAIDRYDPGRGVPFDDFARPRVKGAMVDWLRALDWMPQRLRQKGKRIDSAVTEIRGNGGEAGEVEVAGRLGMSVDVLRGWLLQLSRADVARLEELASEDGEWEGLVSDGGEMDPLERIVDRETIRELGRAIEELPERQRLVVTLVYYEGLTMTEVAELLGVTISRVSQIHSAAVARLREALVAPKQA